MKYTIKQIAALLGLSTQRIATKITQGHFPGHRFCDCGHAILIPEEDLKRPENQRKKKNGHSK